MNKMPNFSELPLGKDDPPFSAWGLYGKDDQLGTLNRLTDDIVKEAAKEIKTGVRISMNWPLDAQADMPFFRRQAFHKHVYPKPPRVVNDDVWTFNTQSSSQWDGLRHFAYQHAERFYNGVTMGDIHASPSSTVNGIHAWAERGIVGRGVLVDFAGWRAALAAQGQAVRPYDPFETGVIKLEELKQCLEWQGTQVRWGDVLILRSGYMEAHQTKPKDELKVLAEVVPPHFSGVEQSPEMLEWIWDHFAAVAGDHPTFECWPSQQSEWSLHEVLLSGWGCPIGEMFDLEGLAAECKKINRWTFFVVSEPCNVPGGVASPPNILAIF
ncbi:hypothetical protein BDY21DRAFT_302730 [Lineolata rhizophorae]|uniref:Cyclase-domain-containing protein n=1 Tax=Lineolata rhizophorae TaxID=578093 RepID=A0A6A6P1P3_9PEZI|nr:hypothetical protein BDY21DRAFT_302730 [Lineolata rhizophorae]